MPATLDPVQLEIFDHLGSWADVSLLAVGVDVGCEDPRTVDPRATPPEIVAIDKTVKELEEQLARLKIQREQILASQALICRIPPEILSRIFELGAHEDAHLLNIISLVSRHWYNVILATPSLWTCLILDIEWGYGRVPEFIRKARLYMDRSQACKFAVHLECRYVDSETDLRDILIVIKPHLHRCYSFRISLPDWEWMSLLREHLTGLGPSLEIFDLRVEPSEAEDAAPYCPLTMPCPRLSFIMLERTPLACVDIETPELRRLHLLRDQRYPSSGRMGVCFKELLSKLEATPTLEELRMEKVVFYLRGSEDVFLDTPSLTEIPSLRWLTFSHLDPSDVSLFLESTSLPAMERLSVQLEQSADEDLHWLSRASHDALVRFPSLRELNLRGCYIDGAAIVPLVRVLHQLPQLVALSLSSPPSGSFGTQIFDLLAGGPAKTGTWILPRLQALCIHNCRDISGHELLRIVIARHGVSNHEVENIQYLKIATCIAIDGDALNQLVALVDTVRVL
ncbi:hypothetical protein OBBRIDRAFT_813261 [Obba rivulosa]|uniref:F-box domain-containing protein n=1 Tax=Obba rivulosa TaxID=1052685 RepID=A0A8E2DN85_9APHY|nr:hypothetical protein OBBRIDRAFT_813261 [Obba rivulosa]